MQCLPSILVRMYLTDSNQNNPTKTHFTWSARSLHLCPAASLFNICSVKFTNFPSFSTFYLHSTPLSVDDRLST